MVDQCRCEASRAEMEPSQFINDVILNSTSIKEYNTDHCFGSLVFSDILHEVRGP